MKVHILSTFPGDSKGKTKTLDPETSQSLIADGFAVSAEDGKPHPEAEKAKKENKEAAGRQTKTDKEADPAKTSQQA